MISKIIWELREDRSIKKVTKLTNRLYANSKASAEYNLISDAILPTDTVKMILTVGEKEYHKLLDYGNVLLETGEIVKGWSIVSNGEELAVEIEDNGYETMIVSFEIKRFSTFDSQTLLTSFTSPQDNVLIYASSSYTPMVEPTDAELLENEISKINVKLDDKVDKVAVYRDNKWVGRVNNNDGIAVALDTSYHPSGSETLGVTAGASVVAQTKYAWLNTYDEVNNSRAYLEPDHFRVETKTPGEASYTALLKVDKNSIQFKDDRVATETDVNKKVDIETVRNVNYNLMPGGQFKGTVTNTFNTEGIMSIESKAEGSKNDTIKLEFDATRSKLTYNKTSDITYNGEVATRPYVDNKSTADRLYVDTKVDAIKKSVGYVFDTYNNFFNWVDGTYVREDGLTTSDLNIGDDIFIVEEGVPDYWVKSKSEHMTITDFVPYESGDYKPIITWLEG